MNRPDPEPQLCLMLYGRYFTDLGPLLLILLLLRLEPLLVPDELLLHEEIVLDALLLEEPQPALGVRGHARQLVRRVGSLHPHVTSQFIMGTYKRNLS